MNMVKKKNMKVNGLRIKWMDREHTNINLEPNTLDHGRVICIMVRVSISLQMSRRAVLIWVNGLNIKCMEKVYSQIKREISGLESLFKEFFNPKCKNS